MRRAGASAPSGLGRRISAAGSAVADKLRRDHGLAPWALAMASVGAATGLVIAITAALQRMGVF